MFDLKWLMLLLLPFLLGACNNDESLVFDAGLSASVYENVSVSLCNGVSSVSVRPNMSYYNLSSKVLTQPETLVYNTTSCTFNASNVGNLTGLVYFSMNQTNSSYVFRCNNVSLNTSSLLVANVSNGTSEVFNCTGEWINATKLFNFDLNYTVNSS